MNRKSTYSVPATVPDDGSMMDLRIEVKHNHPQGRPYPGTKESTKLSFKERSVLETGA